MVRIKATGFDDVTVEVNTIAGTPEAGTINDVFVCGTYVGQVVYHRRVRADGGSVYGWMPEKAPRNSKLYSKHDAVEALLKMDGPARAAKAAREQAPAREELFEQVVEEERDDILTRAAARGEALIERMRQAEQALLFIEHLRRKYYQRREGVPLDDEDLEQELVDEVDQFVWHGTFEEEE